MAYLTSTTIGDAMGIDKRDALAPDAATLAKLIRQASAITEAALSVGGYGAYTASSYLSDASDCPEMIQLMAYGAFVQFAYVRSDLPQDAQLAVNLLEDMRAGKLEIPDLTRSVSRQPGGVVTSSTVTYPQMLSRSRMGGW